MLEGIMLKFGGGRFWVFAHVQPSRFLRRFLHFSPVKLVYVRVLVTFSVETQSTNHALHAKKKLYKERLKTNTELYTFS